MTERLSTKKFKRLNGNILKLIAVVAMTIDHIAWAWVESSSPLGIVLHAIGRLTIPIMCFFVAEGYYFTRSVPNYLGRLFIFAAVSHVPYCLFNGYELTDPVSTSVMYPLFLGLAALAVYQSEKINGILKGAIILFFCFIAIPSDWMFFPVLWILTFGVFTEIPKKQIAAFSVIAAVVCSFFIIADGIDSVYMLGLFLAIPLILMYNGERGRRSPVIKWGFYIYYPLHLMAIYALEQVL